MHWLRKSLAVAAVAAITSLSLVVSMAPAQAFDTIDPNTPPPRISAPSTTTAVPKTLSTSMIPETLLTRIGPLLGLAFAFPLGEGSLGKDMCTVPSEAAKLGSVCNYAKTPVPSGNTPVAKLPDALWCAANAACSGNEAVRGAQPGVYTNWTYGAYIYPQPVLVAGTLSTMNLAPATREDGAGCATLPDYQVIAFCSAPKTFAVGAGYPNSNNTKARGKCLTPGGGFTNLRFGGTDLTQWVNEPLFNNSGNAQQVCPSGSKLLSLEWTGDCQWQNNCHIDYQQTKPGNWVNPDIAGNYYQHTVITSTLSCTLASDTSQHQTLTTTGPPGTGLLPLMSCPAGWVPDGGSTSVNNDLLTAPKKVEEWTITPQTRDLYPLCIGWQAAGCTLQVTLDGNPCLVSTVECRNWEEVYRTQPSRVKCFWGPYEMDISMCDRLRNAYISEWGTTTDPSRPPTASPIPVGPGGMPLPANPDPNYTPAPAPLPTTPPQTDPNAPWNNPAPIPAPGPGVPLPVPNPNPVPTPTTTPNADDSNCWPGGTAAFNPLNWVLQPIKCAAVWAFVPKTDIKAKLDTAAASFGGKAPFSWFDSANVIVAGGAGIGGTCPDWRIKVGPVDQNVVCGNSFTGAILVARPMIFGGMVVAMFWPLIRSIWYALIPVLRVTPTK